MKARLLATLERDIDRWLEKHCEDGDWPDHYMPNNINELMAAAAAAVFDTVKSAQDAKDAS